MVLSIEISPYKTCIKAKRKEDTNFSEIPNKNSLVKPSPRKRHPAHTLAHIHPSAAEKSPREDRARTRRLAFRQRAACPIRAHAALICPRALSPVPPALLSIRRNRLTYVFSEKGTLTLEGAAFSGRKL